MTTLYHAAMSGFRPVEIIFGLIALLALARAWDRIRARDDAE